MTTVQLVKIINTKQFMFRSSGGHEYRFEAKRTKLDKDGVLIKGHHVGRHGLRIERILSTTLVDSFDGDPKDIIESEINDMTKDMSRALERRIVGITPQQPPTETPRWAPGEPTNWESIVLGGPVYAPAHTVMH